MLIDENFIHVWSRGFTFCPTYSCPIFFLGQLVVPVRYGRMMALRVHLLDLVDFGDA